MREKNKFMADLSQSPTCTEKTRGARAAYTVAGIVFFLLTLVMIGKFLHGDLKDAEVWYDAGRRVLEGRTLADLPHYRYPPTFAVLVSPLTALGLAPFFFLWYGLNVGLFGVALWLSGRIAYSEVEQPDARAYWLPALLVAAYGIDNLFLGQTNILVMALLYWCFLDDVNGQGWRAGWPLGAAIAIKVFPVPLIAYFVYRRRWQTAAAAVMACLFFLLILPAPIRGFQRNLTEVKSWADRVALPFVSKGQAGDWGQHSLDFGNQSLPGVARRYLTQVNAQVAAREGRPIYVNIARLAEPQANRVVLGLFAALVLGFAVACGWRPPSTRQQWATEFSLATILLLLTSALSWTYFFVMLLLPARQALLLLARSEGLRTSTRWGLRAALWGLGLATLLLGNHLARALGSIFFATLLLFIALGLACYDLRRSNYALEFPARGQCDN